MKQQESNIKKTVSIQPRHFACSEKALNWILEPNEVNEPIGKPEIE